jgi:hypothetical protein
MMRWQEVPLASRQPTACALGNFDGVHLGHEQVIAKMLAVADQLFGVQSNGERVGTVTAVNATADTVTVATYGAMPQSVGSSTYSVTGATYTYTVASNALIFVLPTEGQAQTGTLSQVATGDHVRYVLNSQGQISWLWDQFATTKVTGTVVQASSSQIEITVSGNTQATYTIAPGAVVTDRHQSISPTALMPGQQVTLGVHNGTVVSLQVGAADAPPPPMPGQGNQPGRRQHQDH